VEKGLTVGLATIALLLVKVAIVNWTAWTERKQV
jgi:hypothetical protein